MAGPGTAAAARQRAGLAGRDARRRLAALLGGRAEPRPQQADYAAAVAAAFAPRDRPDMPQAVLAEAGTGVGKTLGYIAPASLWAEKNQGAVWISTYTRNLQSQIAGELDRLYPDPAQKRRHVVVRKGRENFLCLLNYEDAARGAAARGAQSVAPLVLIARWIGATAAGDLVAGDFPGWLAELIGRGRVNALADRRGECIHSACPHFRRCFVEKNVRAARHARIVVANHALVMAQAALGGLDDATVPTRYVFDEGHHLLEAADAAFSVRLSGQEGRELRRWLLGAEAGRSRARGLQRRIGDLVEADEEAGTGVDRGAGRRPHPAGRRLAAAGRRGARPARVSRAFSRWSAGRCWRAPPASDTGYGLEAEARPPIDGLVEAAGRLAAGLDRLAAGVAPPRRLPARASSKTRRTRPSRGCGSGSMRRSAASNGAPTCSSAAGARCCAISASRRAPRRSSGWRSTGIDGAETDVARQPQLDRSRHPVRRSSGAAGARRRRDLGDLDRRRDASPTSPGRRRRPRPGCATCRRARAPRASPRRSTIRRRPASSSSPTSRATISARSPPPSRR